MIKNIENAFLKKVEEYEEKVLSVGIFEKIKKQSINKEEMKEFVRNRFPIESEFFIPFLNAIIEISKKENEFGIKTAAQSNLADGLEIAEDGFDIKYSHKQGRINGRKVVGVTSGGSRTEKVKKYFLGIIKRGDLLEMGINFSFLEMVIIPEFEMILKTCDSIFHEEMKEIDARRFLEGHIIHDVFHYKEALFALEKSEILKNEKDIKSKIDNFLENFIKIHEEMSIEMNK